LENIITKNEWRVRFEVTFYGNDLTRGSFREIKEDTIVINEEFQINNKVNFDTAENVEINFLLWVDKLPIEELTKVPHDYYSNDVRYDEESIEVLEVIKLS
jgi:hypothetical protein